MFSNFDKYYIYNSRSIISIEEDAGNIYYPEQNYQYDALLYDNNNPLDNVDTDSYVQSQLKEQKNTPCNNSSESNKNASTNSVTKSTKEKAIFEISKNPKKAEYTNNTNNSNLGKKRKNYKNGNHDKYKPDNICRKFKSRIFNVIFNFLNLSIKATPIQNVNFYSKKKKYSKLYFLKIEQNIIYNIDTAFNRKLLQSKLKDIFSNKISKKIKKFDPDYNKILIGKIYKEKIQTKTISILERTFQDCLDHFRGSQYYPELEGLEKEYINVINEMRFKEPDEYIDSFAHFISIFDDYYNNMRKEKNRTNKANKINETNKTSIKIKE